VDDATVAARLDGLLASDEPRLRYGLSDTAVGELVSAAYRGTTLTTAAIDGDSGTSSCSAAPHRPIWTRWRP
jgi:hypothetical protein